MEKMMKKSILLGIALCGLLSVLSTSASAQLINELDINPGGTDQPCEYVELRGTPGSIIQNVHFVAFEGDGAPSGTADLVLTFGTPGPAFGSNGLIVFTGTVACGARTYPAETTRFPTTLLDAANGLENGTISFLLISTPTVITPGTDYDTNNDGILEGLPAGSVILDAVAWSDGDAGDITYGGVVLNAPGIIGGATRFPSNTNPNLGAAWYAGALTGTNDATTYSTTVRTGNFPANGALTPGAPNVGTQPPDSPVDINGDGRTDFVVTRNASGVPGGQLTWHTQFAVGNPFSTREWGISSDTVLAGDYDGDGSDDMTVFRASNGTFYIIQSSTFTMRLEQFGQNGDDPRIVGDYNGDGRDDLAVYRPGTQSMWFYKTSQSALFAAVEWGQTGDTPAPGDYDGDGKADFVVRRAAGTGVFWKRLSGGTFGTELFGLPGDNVIPGDYDGDGKTDLAVFRNTGGVYVWDFEPSGTAGSTVVSDTWGVTGDVVVQGDYDGDSRTDYAIWRPGTTATFYMMTVGTRNITTKGWGQTGDVPAAAYNTF